MSLIDQTSDHLRPWRLEAPTAVFSDGDNTLFYPRTTTLYDDAQQWIESVEDQLVVLVSADPSQQLAKDRAAAIGAASYHIPSRPRWCKAGLFRQAAEEIQPYFFEQAVVIGDRWLMDVVVGKCVVRHVLQKPVQGCLIERRPHEIVQEPFDKFVLSPIESIAGPLGKLVGLRNLVKPSSQE